MLKLTFIILSYSQLDAHFWGVSEVPLLKGWIVCGGLVLTSQQLSELQKTFYQTRNLFQFILLLPNKPVLPDWTIFASSWQYIFLQP